MIHPPLDELLKRTGNRYTLVNIAAKRACQIMKEGTGGEECTNKAITTALEEIVSGKTTFERPKSGIK